MCQFREYDEFNNGICSLYKCSCEQHDCESMKPNEFDLLNGYCENCDSNDTCNKKTCKFQCQCGSMKISEKTTYDKQEYGLIEIEYSCNNCGKKWTREE